MFRKALAADDPVAAAAFAPLPHLVIGLWMLKL